MITRRSGVSLVGLGCLALACSGKNGGAGNLGGATSASATGGDAGGGRGGTAGQASGSAGRGGAPVSACSGAGHSTAAAGPAPDQIALAAPAGFALTTIAKIGQARQLVALPNGDLLVATNAASTYLIPNADGLTAPGAPSVFTTPDEAPAQGIAFDAASCTVYLASEHDIYALPYADGQQTASAGPPIATVRNGGVSPNRPAGDTDEHLSTSIAVAGGALYAGVGSSCNACVETDPTRASIQRLDLNGAHMTTKATRFRNAVALAENRATGTLWAGGAGQDSLPANHPFEFFDAVSSRPGVADYGWPDCEENQLAYTAGASCGETVAPLVELPAYSTIVGAAFYPTDPTGPYAFPPSYRGGLFLTAHGSWHTSSDGAYSAAPLVVFVAMGRNGDGSVADVPAAPVDWTDPTKQWTVFVGGFQASDGRTRIARPTGIAVGPLGSLFVADDQNGYIVRIRPAAP